MKFKALLTENGVNMLEKRFLPALDKLFKMSQFLSFELRNALDMTQDLPQTLVQVPDLNQLQNFVDRMRHVGDALNVSTSKLGHSRATSRGDSQSVQVSVEHFAKSLQCHLTKPDCAFYGIAPQGYFSFSFLVLVVQINQLVCFL
ncbi:hypothetical protein L6164_004509 [Bauhinia variegata]|uniref:Uncharacterized protein n=1 Tax=Bauhinia variegata TaxID=167791 RepID=A0ACB9Q3S5_BAUVA|nr:hypothetical protein L6164_004509 [Bauhinia variegata]